MYERHAPAGSTATGDRARAPRRTSPDARRPERGTGCRRLRARARAGPADVPGVAAIADRARLRDSVRSRRRHVTPSTPSRRRRVLGPQQRRRRTRSSDVATTRCCPARRARRRGRRRRGRGGRGRRCRTSPPSGPTTATSCGTRRTGEVRFGPRIRYPDGDDPPARRGPADGARSRSPATATAAAPRATSAPGTLVGAAHAAPVRGAGGEPAARHRRRRRRDRRQRQGPRPADAARRATARSPPRTSSGWRSRLDRGRPRPLPAAGETRRGAVRLLVVPACAARRPRRTSTTSPSPELSWRDRRAHLDERRILGTAIEIGTPYYQGVTVAALLAARPGRPAALVRRAGARRAVPLLNPLTGGPHRHRLAVRVGCDTR